MPRSKKISTEDTTKTKETRPKIEFEKLTEGIYAINYKETGTSLKYTKESMLRILETSDEIKLRQASRYFFLISGEYRRLVWYFSRILTFDYFVSPQLKTEDQIKEKNFKSGFDKILKYTDDSYISEVSRFIAFITVLDGVFYGYERNLNNTIAMQQLPSEYCRSRFKIDGAYAVEFDVSFFDSFRTNNEKIDALSLFPEDVIDAYTAYINSKDTKWVLLNPEFARCHKLTDSAMPLLSTTFPDLIGLKEYKELDRSQTDMDLYRLIIQRLPIDKESGLPTLQLEEGQALHTNAKKMIKNPGIDVLTTPLETEAINLQEKGQTVRDNIEKAENMVSNAAGTSRMLFSSNEGGSIGLDKSVKVDESIMFDLLDQYKRWYENKFQYLVSSRNYWFEITFPRITIFNWKDMVSTFKELATLGYSKLLPAICTGIKQTTFMNLLTLENDYLKLNDKMIPLSTSYTESGSGRPEKDLDKLSPKGQETREGNKNDERGKT